MWTARFCSASLSAHTFSAASTRSSSPTIAMCFATFPESRLNSGYFSMNRLMSAMDSSWPEICALSLYLFTYDETRSPSSPKFR